jgi:hypothetical protein
MTYDSPRPVPGNIAFGQVTSGLNGAERTIGDNADSPYSGDASNKVRFTTFTVVFTASGSAVKSVDCKEWSSDRKSGAATTKVIYDKSDGVFTENVSGYGPMTQLWDWSTANGHYATTAVTLFDMSKYATTIREGGSPLSYLNKNAQLLPLNINTGQMFVRE